MGFIRPSAKAARLGVRGVCSLGLKAWIRSCLRSISASASVKIKNDLGAVYPSPKKVDLSIMVGLYKPKKVKGYLLSY